MKKSNLITLISLIILMLVIGFGSRLWKATAQSSDSSNAAVPEPATKAVTEASVSVSGTDEGQKDKQTEDKPVSMDDALFIGDSRTVGLSEYAGIEGADFYANVGMSVYNLQEKAIPVPTVGKVTLEELLSEKQYGKIYVMLGINEMGYGFDQTIAKYKSLVEYIEEKQPDAVVFVQANLHVTKSRSDGDSVINNQAINRFNKAVSEIADGKKVFYLDANSVFDDSEGNLSADKSGDNTHLFAKCYIEWGEWIISQTKALLEEVNR